MALNWIEILPANKDTEAMLRFILSMCQGARSWVYLRTMRGELRGMEKPREVIVDEWLEEYINSHQMASSVPKMALRNAIEQAIISNGIKAIASRNYNRFTIGPREGWRRDPNQEKRMSWEDYTRGNQQNRLNDARTVWPSKTTRELFEHGKLSFRWGTIWLQKWYFRKLKHLADDKKIDPESFLRHVKSIEFVQVSQDETGKVVSWKVNFVLE